MLHPTALRRVVAHTLAGCMLLGAIALPTQAFAQGEEQPGIELRPHCDDPTESENLFGGPVPDNPFMTKPMAGEACHQFEIKDPQTRQTQVLSPGDTLDMDLVFRNPKSDTIQRVRAWIAYDPSILIGESVEIKQIFNRPNPEEQTFSPGDGYIKVGASADAPPADSKIIIARIKVKILPSMANQTVLSFYHPGPEVTTETAVVTTKNGQEQNLLRPPMGSLLVRLAGPGIQQSSAAASIAPPPMPVASSAAPSSIAVSSVPASSSSVATSSSAASTGNSVFKLLQVQNLRATTEETNVYLAWDPLKSAELAGYNVYYGTVSGEYLQRRSVDKTSTTLTIRNLPAGVRYYFAVRGVNTKSEESEFSQEVAVTIGKPETSTSPLLAGDVTGKGPAGKAPKTGGKVAGDTGISSGLMLFLLASAVMGTMLALRRQYAATLPAR